MFRRIPASLHDTLALGMTTGAEIVVQKIIKLEPDFLILRGRISGNQDSIRIMMIPYQHLTSAGIQRVMKDPEVEAIFGKGAPPAVADLPTPGAGDEAPAESAPGDAAAAEPAAESPAKKPEPVSKTMLLAKLRERMKDAGK